MLISLEIWLNLLQLNDMDLNTLVDFLNTTFQVNKIQDFPNAFNGLQLENEGCISKIVGAVDANRSSIEAAIQQGADLLFVHHGLYWDGVQPMIGPVWELYREAMQANLAIYSLHLPLDVHPLYSHNREIARALDLSIDGSFAHFMNQSCGLICQNNSKKSLQHSLEKIFPKSLHKLCFGGVPQRVGIVSGSGGQELLKEMLKANIDTLITGEVRYAAVSFAQLHKLNIYACGHYATECFGVKSVLNLLHQHTGLPCEFIDTFCEL